MERIGIIDMGSNTVRLVVYEIGEETQNVQTSAKDKTKSKDKPGKSQKVASHTSAAAEAKSEKATASENVAKAPEKNLVPPMPERMGFADGHLEPEPSIPAIPPFTSIFDSKATLGLVAAIREGHLEDEAVTALINTLKRHKTTAELLGAQTIKVFATAFVREVENGSEIRGLLEEEVNLPITILSGDEEAHLGFVGATHAHPIDNGTIVDLGGGSCELTAVRGGKDITRVSIPMGCVTAFARYVRVVLPTPSEVARIQAGFGEALEGIDLSLFQSPSIVGIGGAFRLSAAMLGQFWDQPVPKSFSIDELDRLMAIQEGDPHRFAHQLVLCDASRMHSAVPGMAILQKLMETLGARHLHLGQGGAREGFLIERILAQRARS